MAVLRLAWCLSTETYTTTNIGSEAAGNFCIWQRGCRRSGRISLAWSQTYPTRPAHWIVSFSKCGPNDIVAWLDGRADEYRRRAQQCLEMARTFGDRDARVTLSHMAQAWLRLADTTAPEQK